MKNKKLTVDELVARYDCLISRRLQPGKYFGIPTRRKFCIAKWHKGHWEEMGQLTRLYRKSAVLHEPIELDEFHILINKPRTIVLQMLPRLRKHPMYLDSLIQQDRKYFKNHPSLDLS